MPRPKRTRVVAPGGFRTEVRFLTDSDTGERFLLAMGKVTTVRRPPLLPADRLELIRRATDRAERPKMRRACLEELIRRDTEGQPK